MQEIDKYYMCSSVVKENLISTLKRIIKAVNEREKIVIYGYYDLDSITAISLLILILQYLNADVEYYIPDKADYKFGLSEDAINNHIKFLGAKLILTVGCGLNNFYEIKKCNELGIDVIVTDYHKMSQKKLEACLVTFDRSEVRYYENNLTAICVAYKLAKVIAQYYQINCIEKYLDLVLIGIMSKNMPINGYNKKNVKKGIRQLKISNNYGIMALKKILNIKEVNIYNISKLISTIMPTINSVGKMDNAKIIVELLTTSNFNRAEQISKYLKTQMENSDYLANVYRNQIEKLRTFAHNLQ